MSIQIKQISIQNKSNYTSILKRAQNDLTDAFDVVLPIIQEVKKKGDEAVKHYTKKFDGIELKNYYINVQELKIDVPESWKDALKAAKDNISEFHSAQLRNKLEVQVSGNRLGIRYTPIESVAVYAPGGKAIYPSSILMGTIPAKLAGVKNVNLITPPSRDGSDLNPVLLYAAKLSGIDKIYTIGGAQAVAAVGYGTETIQRSEFIVGPGNRYVTAAKSYLSGIGQIGIESPAGPSEVLIIADDTANPKWVACDMLSQAEHGEDSVAILTTNSINLAKEVQLQLDIQMAERPKRLDMKKRAIEENSFILVFPNISECIEFSNLYAPEHLEIMTTNYNQDFEKIQHAGSVFLGNYSPVAIGDYISGTNHILPTAGGSRIYSSLGVDTFLKRMTYQEINKQSLEKLYPHVKVLSEIEGLDSEHGTSVYYRTLE